MYPNLYKGLNLKLEDSTGYDSPLLGFDEKFVLLKGQIRLLVQVGLEVVEVDFIVVYLLPIHRHCGKTLASCPGGCFFHLPLEGEVSFQGSS